MRGDLENIVNHLRQTKLPMSWLRHVALVFIFNSDITNTLAMLGICDLPVANGSGLFASPPQSLPWSVQQERGLQKFQTTGIGLGMDPANERHRYNVGIRPANERRLYNVTSLIGWALTYILMTSLIDWFLKLLTKVCNEVALCQRSTSTFFDKQIIKM